MKYKEVVETLFKLLAVANAADADDAADWQAPKDANQRDGLFGDIHKAILRIAGNDVLDHWAASGEVEMRLCRRTLQQHDDRYAKAWYVRMPREFHALGPYRFKSHVTAEHAVELVIAQFGLPPAEVWPDGETTEGNEYEYDYTYTE